MLAETTEVVPCVQRFWYRQAMFWALSAIPPLFAPPAPVSLPPGAAAAANAYLAQLHGLTCLHVLPDQAIEEECNEDGDVYAQQPIPLPGARSLTLPQVRAAAGWQAAVVA